MQAVNTDVELAEAGRNAVLEGIRLWHQDVGDPAPRFLTKPAPDATPKLITLHGRAARWREVIDHIHVQAGWGADTPYKGNHAPGSREWCGFFAATCWRAAGIDPRWLAAFWAGTLRLQSWVNYRDWNEHKNPLPAAGVQRRLVAKLGREATVASLPFTPREGDIAIIGDDAGRPEGRHITLVTGIDHALGHVLTVEGNGWGRPPVGADREGIVMGSRKIGGSGDRVMWIYRPAPSDLL